jgi:hypothetical protein
MNRPLTYDEIERKRERYKSRRDAKLKAIAEAAKKNPSPSQLKQTTLEAST